MGVNPQHPRASDASQRQSISADPPPENLRELYYKHFGEYARERRLFATGSFFVTFAAVRGVTHAIRAGRGPFHDITRGGRHLHHMTFGIGGLLSVGYLWMLEIGMNDERWSSRATAGVFGSGAALTLDEFALWLNLEDVYWAKQGRESIDAVVLFGALLAMSALGKGFLNELLAGRQHPVDEQPPSNGNGRH
ncbi:MAG: hypothetical protein ACYCUM_03625 [Solirubrobacteraceae bacterium]